MNLVEKIKKKKKKRNKRNKRTLCSIDTFFQMVTRLTILSIRLNFKYREIKYPFLNNTINIFFYKFFFLFQKIVKITF